MTETLFSRYTGFNKENGGDFFQMNHKMLHMVAFVLMAVGAINWGLIALVNFDIVKAIFGGIPPLMSSVYVLIALSGVYILATHQKDCRVCSGKK